MIYRPPEELPNEHQLHVPVNYGQYRPITDSLFQDLFPSAEFPNEEFASIPVVDTNL